MMALLTQTLGTKIKYGHILRRGFSSSWEGKYIPSSFKYVAPAKVKRDVIIIGGGHNGLVTAAYLAKSGLDVLVLERRHCLGGAAVTEEIEPGFKYSRASYLAGLLRPQIIQDLSLEKYGFKYIPRNPSSFTPTLFGSKYNGKYLMLGSDENANWESIAQFSKKDADAYPKYEEFLGKIRDIMQPILDSAPMDLTEGNWPEKKATMHSMVDLIMTAFRHRDALVPGYELMVGPAEHILNRWFESDILKTTLATDAVIGAMCSPKSLGSAYVLLHHVMGEAAGKKGVWAYVEGGMGAVSEAIAASARSFGAETIVNAYVKSIQFEKNRAVGVIMDDGSLLSAKTIISGTSPFHTFSELCSRDDQETLFPSGFMQHIKQTDFSCGCVKINCAIKSLPNFSCFPSPEGGKPGPMHYGTIHFESTMAEIEEAYKDAIQGRPARRPLIEMTIPSSLDKTLSPPGMHVAQLFVQYAPYQLDPSVGSWADPSFREAFADRCLNIVEEFCPGFKSSIISKDILTPLDLEQIFGLPKGNIHHAALGLHQLGYMRPAPGFSSHRSPVPGLYMCASGCHPGGGVMGAPGRNCANVVKSDLYRLS